MFKIFSSNKETSQFLTEKGKEERRLQKQNLIQVI